MVPQTAVVVWQLRGYVEDVYCYFLRRPSALLLVIERAGEVLVQEEHPDLRALMARSSTLRSSLVGVGFAPVEQAESVPSPLLAPLLADFVRDGTAVVHVRPFA